MVLLRPEIRPAVPSITSGLLPLPALPTVILSASEADAVFVGAGQDVAVAFDAQAVTQFLRTGRTVVGGKGQAFVVQRVFRRDAFGDVGFSFVGQVEGVIGNTVGVFRTFADFNRAVSRLAEGGLVGVDGVLGVVTVHFFADGHVLTGNDGGGFSVAASCSFNWATLTASVSAAPLATLAILLPPLFRPAVVSDAGSESRLHRSSDRR